MHKIFYAGENNKHLTAGNSFQKCFTSDQNMIQYLLRKYYPCNENPLAPECLPTEIEKKATLAYIKRSREYESPRGLRGNMAYP
ncbi:hypothetical protein ACTXT7_003693 [Hymenolepis weldensis]